MKIYRSIPWVLLALVIVAGSLFLARWVGAQMDVTSKEVALTPTTAPIVAQDRLFDPDLDPESRAALAEKLEMQAQIEADRAAGAADPAQKDRPSILPNSGGKDAPSQPETGIYPGSDGMVKPEVADINNYWVGPADGRTLIIMAGSLPGDEQAGLVVVMFNDGFSVTGYQEIRAPEGIWALRVLAQEDAALVLEDAQAQQVRFDLAALGFIP